LREVKEKIIPNEFAVFALSTDKSPSEVTLRSSEWAVITQIDGHKSVMDIASTLALSKEEAIQLFTGLYEKELIEIRSDAPLGADLVPLSVFENMEMELTRVIGPVAPFIVDEALIEMGLTKDKFVQDRLPELVELVSEEITDAHKKVQFQQIMLNYLKELNIT
jgi:hypothetical protein